MRRPVLIRLLSIVIFSGIIGSVIGRDVWKKHSMGRAAYLISQGNYFDKTLAGISHPRVHAMGYAVFIGAFVLVYELIAYMLRRLLAVIRPQMERA